MNALGRIPQPWLFLILAVGFGLIAYFASGGSIVRGVLGGLAFGAAVSGWLRLRARLWRDER